MMGAREEHVEVQTTVYVLATARTITIQIQALCLNICQVCAIKPPANSAVAAMAAPVTGT